MSAVQISIADELSKHWYALVEVIGHYESAQVKVPGGLGYVAFLKVEGAKGPVYIDLFNRVGDEVQRLEGHRVCVCGQIQPPVEADQPLHLAARDNLPALVSITAITPVEDKS